MTDSAFLTKPHRARSRRIFSTVWIAIFPGASLLSACHRLSAPLKIRAHDSENGRPSLCCFLQIKKPRPKTRLLGNPSLYRPGDAELLAFNFFQTIKWRTATQRFFNTDQLVVLSDTVRTAHRTGFDLACCCTYRQIGNGSIFSFA